MDESTLLLYCPFYHYSHIKIRTNIFYIRKFINYLNNFPGLLRCGKSCRLRWTNYLRPDIKRGPFSPEEEKLVIQLHAILGNRYCSYSNPCPFSAKGTQCWSLNPNVDWDFYLHYANGLI